MKKKYIILLVLFITILILIITIKNVNHNLKNLKNIYMSEQELENITISINDIKNNKQIHITNAEDIAFIISTIKNDNLKPIPKSETLLGGILRFTISNKKYNTSINLNIGSSQITINNKTYKTQKNLQQKIKNVYLKYCNEIY